MASDITRLSCYHDSSFHRLPDLDLLLLAKLTQKHQKIGKQFIAGGLQQLLNKHSLDKRIRDSAEAERHCPPVLRRSLNHHHLGPDRDGQLLIEETTIPTFSNLPVSIQLHIFSYLQPLDLCRVSAVSNHWATISADEVLWSQLLHRDASTWPIVGHLTNPDMYHEVNSDWPAKEIYLKCCPETNKLRRREHIAFHNLSTIFRYILPSRNPKVVLFGPGLIKPTKRIVRQIFQTEDDSFKVIGYAPSEHQGVGSGIWIKVNNKLTMNLVTLYPSSQREREGWNDVDREKNNRLLAWDEEAQEVRPTRNVQSLCRTVDAFIFIIDASAESGNCFMSSRDELRVMVNEQWSDVTAPLLVLACIPTEDVKRHSAITVARDLKLTQLNRPWQVANAVSENLNGVGISVEWLIQQASRR